MSGELGSFLIVGHACWHSGDFQSCAFLQNPVEARDMPHEPPGAAGLLDTVRKESQTYTYSLRDNLEPEGGGLVLPSETWKQKEEGQCIARTCLSYINNERAISSYREESSTLCEKAFYIK